MIERNDILSIGFLQKSEYTGSHRGMRYRLEKSKIEDEVRLLVTLWPEPFNFVNTPEDKKLTQTFAFEEQGVIEAVAWMNRKLEENKSVWEQSAKLWDAYDKY
ncbi:MAG: hypothetical protein IJB84_06015 [Lachnospiraceae bacterium]|nr:hypothetical protein [Lachnospiraceae bacterium]